MAKKFPSDEQDQYMVRFPHGMRETLKNHARDNGRSLNAEILQRLEFTLKVGTAYMDYPSYVADYKAEKDTEVSAAVAALERERNSLKLLIEEARSFRDEVRELRNELSAAVINTNK